jgi:hypothetical protein
MLKQNQIIHHKIMNVLHTALLFGGVLLLVAIIGYAVGGTGDQAVNPNGYVTSGHHS